MQSQSRFRLRSISHLVSHAGGGRAVRHGRGTTQHLRVVRPTQPACLSVCRGVFTAAGFVSAALCSVLVGSVHYASFCWSKRLALQAMDPSSSGSSSSSDSSHSANMLAASIGALATALVESPVEMFRHQAQAGTVGGNFVQEMVTSVRKNVSEMGV